MAAGALIGCIADGSHGSSAFGEAFGQHQDILEFVSTPKLIAQGSDLMNAQQCTIRNLYLKPDSFHMLYRHTNSTT